MYTLPMCLQLATAFEYFILFVDDSFICVAVYIATNDNTNLFQYDQIVVTAQMKPARPTEMTPENNSVSAQVFCCHFILISYMKSAE